MPKTTSKRRSGKARRSKSVSPPRPSSGGARSLSSDALSPDWLAFLRSLSARNVRFVLVGGLAVIAHGHVRTTGDMDVWVERTPANARRVRAALADFGFASVAPPLRALLSPRKVFMLGRRPNRIDIMTALEGLEFADAWRSRIVATVGGDEIGLLGRADLVASKLRAGRPKDLADVDALERLGRAEARLRARRR